MNEILVCDYVSSFSRIGKKKAFQTLEKKTDELTDMRDLGEFPLLSLGYSSVLSVPGEQSDIKYQWVVIRTIYKKECVWRSIASNFVT